jgi:CRISPR-associated protein Csm4
MSKIQILRLRQNSGLLTELQSDTIWGHFCWRLKEKHGEESLKNFLKDYEDGNPVFTVSSSFFEKKDSIYISYPLNGNQHEDIGNVSKREKIEAFLKHKKMKSRKFLNSTDFNSYLQTGSWQQNESEELEEPSYLDSLRTSVEISRETLSSKKSQLFSYSGRYVNEEFLKDTLEFTCTNTIVFVKILNEEKFAEMKGADLIEDTFDIGFGKKKSSGFGAFKILEPLRDFTDFKEPETSNGFITLGNYLPSENDGVSDYFYEILVKYGKLGEKLSLSANPFKRPFIMLTPGSVFLTDKRSDYYGRCTNTGEISKSFPSVLQSGYAFSLRVNLASPK